MPSEGPDNYIWYLDSFTVEKLPFLGTDFDRTAAKDRVNMEMLQYKLPLIVVVAP